MKIWHCLFLVYGPGTNCYNPVIRPGVGSRFDTTCYRKSTDIMDKFLVGLKIKNQRKQTS